MDAACFAQKTSLDAPAYHDLHNGMREIRGTIKTAANPVIDPVKETREERLT